MGCGASATAAPAPTQGTAANVSTAAPAPTQGAAANVVKQRQEPRIAHLEIWGNHGCPFFVTAAKAAAVLHARGAVAKVVIHRVGYRHVPIWSSPANKQPFLDLVKDLPHTELWQGGSPRVVVDHRADAPLGASELLQSVEGALRGADFGLPPEARARTPDLCDAIRDHGALALWLMAYQDGGHADFFSADPPGAPLHGARAGLTYDDLDTTDYAPHPFDSAGAVLEKAASRIQAMQQGKAARARVQQMRAGTGK